MIPVLSIFSVSPKGSEKNFPQYCTCLTDARRNAAPWSIFTVNIMLQPGVFACTSLTMRLIAGF